MHPLNCPSWEYSTHPQHAVIPFRVSEVLTALATGGIDTLLLATDTRDVHHRVFQQLTPINCDYYAGHYRGERFRCLQFYRVAIPGDARVGVAPESVAFRIGEINAEIRTGIMAIDANALLTAKERLRYILALTCRAFVAFLTVHPYANGNGHAGRFIVWSLMGRYGHWPRRWPVEPRPPDPPYSQLIMNCRDGDPAPLERYLLQCLVG
jgi:hypothetical protein